MRTFRADATPADTATAHRPGRARLGRVRLGRVRSAALAPGAALLIAVCGMPLAAPGASAAAPTVAAGAADPAPGPSDPSAPSAGPALKPIDPAKLRSAVDAAAKKLLILGTVVLLRTPQGTFRVLTGTAELGKDRPPTTADHFRIASNTKTMTSALIQLLVQDGKVRLTDPVSDYVPGVPGGAGITIAELLEMRSGLYNYTDAPEFSAALDADPGKAWTPQEVLDIAFRHPPDAAPGTEYAYDNTNYALLGLVAEKAGGRPLAEQLRDRLFTPLGLTGTSLPGIHDTSLPAPYAHGYMYGGSAHAMTDEPYPADVQAAARSGKLKPLDYTHQNSSYATAAGGAVSTADDTATWIKALVTGKVLDPASQKRWLDSPRPQNPAAPDAQQYGYGIAYQRFTPQASMYFHGGELPGFNSFMGHDPDNDVTLVVWANLTVSLDAKAAAMALLPTILNQVYSGVSYPTVTDHDDPGSRR
ncbi:serine hydrolase domain-containing protein [Streptomyces sp. NPDC058401]|uniref:serine hydrolase domain-containing protein n=1 Tax=Streptomyces sp. NPDC058401 TaxID=3346480 RepID=UPI00366A54D3